MLNAPTIAEALREAGRRLGDAGVPSPEVDARLLLAHVLGRRPHALVLDARRRLAAREHAAFAELLSRRAARYPLQLLLEEVEFYGRRFRVAPGVLVPRFETEVVAEAALRLLAPGSPPSSPAASPGPAAADRRAAEGWRARPLNIADIGSGAGVLGLTLAAERPRAQVICVDRTPAAASLAATNARALGVAARVQVVLGDGVAVLARDVFDLVVSNPPYLPTELIATLAPEVRDHDPRLALDGGPDGLAVIARLLVETGAVLRPGGHLVLEIGHDQAAAAIGLATQHGWQEVAVRPDLAGHDRVLAARRPR